VREEHETRSGSAGEDDPQQHHDPARHGIATAPPVLRGSVGGCQLGCAGEEPGHYDGQGCQGQPPADAVEDRRCHETEQNRAGGVGAHDETGGSPAARCGNACGEPGGHAVGQPVGGAEEQSDADPEDQRVLRRRCDQQPAAAEPCGRVQQPARPGAPLQWPQDQQDDGEDHDRRGEDEGRAPVGHPHRLGGRPRHEAPAEQGSHSKVRHDTGQDRPTPGPARLPGARTGHVRWCTSSRR
jgi:hypothetical protein